MSSSREKLSLTLRGARRFLAIYRHNRRGMLGIIILIFFAILSIAAPLITPYDPTEAYLSGDYSTPSWFQYVIPNLSYSNNFNMLPRAGLPTAASINDMWNHTDFAEINRALSSAQVSLSYDPNGYRVPGSFSINFQRDRNSYAGDTAEIHLTHQFNNPYSGPPKRFEARLAWSTEGLENLQQVEMALFISRLEAGSSNVTTYPVWIDQIEQTAVWTTPSPPIDSYHSTVKDLVADVKSDPAAIIFKGYSSFIFDLRIRLVDKSTSKPVDATVRIADVDMKFYGTSFGLLGTDHLGRDIFSELAYGSRISLFIGLLSAALSVIIGLAVGLVSGYLGRFVDEITMRFTDMLLVLPGLPLLIVLISVLGPSMFNLILLIGVLGWMSFARVVRSQVLSLKERPFVEAAKAVGAGKFHIILRHILPNVMSLVYITLALSVPGAILSEAALSYLGLFDPTVISWGRMLNEAQNNEGLNKWWWIVPPGISIALVSLSFVLLGYALDEILNPKLRQRR